jgi:hypothetical protein
MSVEDRLREAASELRTANRTLPVPQRVRGARRRRGLIVASAVGLAAALIAGVLVSLLGSRPSNVVVGPPPQSVEQVFAKAAITSALSWHGRIIAAGSISPPDCRAGEGAACASGGIPAVWSSTPSSGWTRAWTARSSQSSMDTTPLGQPASSGPTTQTLLDAGNTLYLVSSATQSRISPTSGGADTLEMWESSDAVTWRQLSLPASLASSPIASAVYGHGRVVLLARSQFAATIWTSTNGTRWHTATGGLNGLSPGLGTLTVTPSGYIMGLPTSALGSATSGPQNLPTVWNSTDAAQWSPTIVTNTKGSVTNLATRGNVTVAVVAVNYGYDSFYVTTDGRNWTAAAIPAGMTNTSAIKIFPTGSGFVATNRYSMPLLAAPSSGRPWAALQPDGIPQSGQFAADTLIDGPDGKLTIFGYTPGPGAFDRPWTTASPTSTANSPVGSLELFISDQDAKHLLAAAVAGHPEWRQGSTHTDPVRDGNNLIAVVAFSYDPGNKPVWVLTYKNGTWTQTASQTDPWCPCPPGHAPTPSSIDPSHPIQVADVTGDGRPDFLIPLSGADNTPGAVLSQDGAPPTQWRYIPFTGPFPAANYTGRDPKFDGTTLLSTFNDCEPSCAQGHTTTIQWTYQPNTGDFWAPNPPGWTAQPGATHQTG